MLKHPNYRRAVYGVPPQKLFETGICVSYFCNVAIGTYYIEGKLEHVEAVGNQFNLPFAGEIEKVPTFIPNCSVVVPHESEDL